jgi:uncharacterized alkaline shock family protein YloU
LIEYLSIFGGILTIALKFFSGVIRGEKYKLCDYLRTDERNDEVDVATDGDIKVDFTLVILYGKIYLQNLEHLSIIFHCLVAQSNQMKF